MTSIPDQSNRYEELRRSVHQAIGQSVVFYQQIELVLKSMLPHLIPADGYVCDDPLAEVQKLLGSRETLGPLMERLKRTFQSSCPEPLSDYLTQVVTNRNQLVHAFVRQPFGGLNDVESCEAALRHVEAQHSYAVPFIQLLYKMADGMVEATKERDGGS